MMNAFTGMAWLSTIARVSTLPYYGSVNESCMISTAFFNFWTYSHLVKCSPNAVRSNTCPAQNIREEARTYMSATIFKIESECSLVIVLVLRF